ncbi:hypothetical protein [Streptomyces sp. NPDC057287]|uniref:hypothetical protein n=1 Tax=Streptomyces sp. NPDC057287 TaxID=3346086 RepID=UPI00362BD773
MATTRPREPVLLVPQGPVSTAIACTVGAILMLGASYDVPTYRFGGVTQGAVLPARVDPTSRVFTLA